MAAGRGNRTPAWWIRVFGHGFAVLEQGAWPRAGQPNLQANGQRHRAESAAAGGGSSRPGRSRRVRTRLGRVFGQTPATNERSGGGREEAVRPSWMRVTSNRQGSVPCGRAAGPRMKPPRPDAVGSSLRTRHDGQRAKRRKTGRGRPSRVERGSVIRASHGCGQTGWPDLGTDHRVRTLAGGVFGRRSRANGRSGGSRGEVARRARNRMASNPVSFVSVGALPSGRGHGRRVRRRSGRVFGRCSAEDGHDSLDRGREVANLHERLAPPASFAAGVARQTQRGSTVVAAVRRTEPSGDVRRARHQQSAPGETAMPFGRTGLTLRGRPGSAGQLRSGPNRYGCGQSKCRHPDCDGAVERRTKETEPSGEGTRIRREAAKSWKGR